MEKILKYKPNSILRMNISTKKRIAIQSYRGVSSAIDLRFPVNEAYSKLVGAWLIECKSKTVLLRELEFPHESDNLIISFENGNENVDFEYITPENRIVNVSINSSKIEVQAGGVIKVSVFTPNNTSAPTPTPNPTPTPTPTPAPSGNTRTPNDTSANEIRELKKLLADEQKKYKTLQSEFNKLADHNIAELRENSFMDSVINQKITIIQRLTRENAEIQSNIDEKQAEVDRLAQQVEEKNVTLASIEAQRSELESQLAEFESQKEFLELDCDEATNRLKASRVQVELDAETLQLIEDDKILKRKSISKALDGIEKEIAAVEKRISLIIKFRTKYNSAVETAIFKGNGEIPDTEEIFNINRADSDSSAGGEADGNGTTAAQTDQ